MLGSGIVSVLLAYPLTFTIVRVLGKKQISTLTYWDMVSAIALGSLAANIVTNRSVTLWESAGVVALWGLLTLMTGWAVLKSRGVRRILEGMPTVIIANGQLLEEAMRQERLTMDVLFAELRTQGVFAIRDVEFAVMEPNGKLSVLKRSQLQPITPKDIRVPTAYAGLATAVVMEGSILEENLTRVGLDRAWLLTQLNAQGVRDLSSVFYAELLTDGTLYVDRRGDQDQTDWSQH